MDPEETINQIKDSVRQLIALVMQTGQEPPPEMRELFMRALLHAERQIQDLRAQQSPVDQDIGNIQEPEEKLKMARNMPSSNVHSFGYDPKNQELYVRFQGDYPDQNGPVYKYGGVPKQIFNMFQQGSVPAKTNGRNEWGEWWIGKKPSLGASLYALIRNGGYQYQRLT